jgi:hypothetical protein
MSFAPHDARKMGRDAKALRKEFLRFFLVFSHKKCPIANKTGKNRKKPVETEEMWLTKRSERMKVKCGTVLRTRMNIDDFALKTGCGFTKSLCGEGEQDPRIYFESKKEQDKWQRE